MTATLTSLKPEDVADRLKRGLVTLVDIREPDEFARRHVKGALSRPLSAFENAHIKILPGRDVVFTCRSGMRTAANCQRLGAATDGAAFILEGGIDGWAAAGLPVVDDKSAPLEMTRQVQVAAGLLVLLGVGLGVFLHPGFLGIAAFAGAGLTFAGATGFCGMARVLALAPWNARSRAR